MIHEQSKILNMEEEKILQKAIYQFTKLTGVGVKILGNQIKNNNRDHVDAFIELKAGNQAIRFFVNIKNEIREQTLPDLFKQMHKNPGEWLLVCRYIPMPLKEILKDQGINYLETAGNCYIRKEGLLLYINGKAVTKERQPKEGKVWKTAGIKFLFGILIQPELLNEPYRKMAETTGVALGNIGPFLGELKKEGFLKEGIENGIPILFLENTEALRNKWTGLFNAVLKPKLKQGRFKFADKQTIDAWEKIPDAGFYWGGEPAGALLTKQLRPEILTIYTNQPKITLMKQLKLIPDPEGNIEILELFWYEQLTNKQKTVPPLLAYADLVNSLDSRNREIAERIKQQYLETTH
jgi:hypothetical protein